MIINKIVKEWKGKKRVPKYKKLIKNSKIRHQKNVLKPLRICLPLIGI